MKKYKNTFSTTKIQFEIFISLYKYIITTIGVSGLNLARCSLREMQTNCFVRNAMFHVFNFI